MSAVQSLDGIRRTLSQFWEVRNQRERRLLLGAAVVIVLALFYLVLINPAFSGRKALDKSLPALRQQVAEVQALAGEAKTLGAKASTAAPALTREGLEAGLVKRSLKPQALSVSGEMTKVQFAAASFAGIVDWLAEMQNVARLSVVEANVEALAQPDQVNASFTLRQQKNEQAR